MLVFLPAISGVISSAATVSVNEPMYATVLRDVPFDIQGGWDFSSRQVIFFSLFAKHVIFFKSKLQQVFFFK